MSEHEIKNENTDKKPLILIVDDVPKNIQVLGNILNKEECQIAAATNGKQALAMVDDITPDLILLDIMMPEVDGFEVCRRLKESAATQDIPVIFLTAKTDTEDIVKGFEIGAVDYVTKPFNSTELLARVHTHLALQKARNYEKNLNQELEQKLILSEKMASLGNLVAGATHEINTPLGIAVTAASHLSERTGNMAQLRDSGSMKRSDLDTYLQTVDETSHILLTNLNRSASLIKSLKIIAVDQCSEEKRIFRLKEYTSEILLSLRPKLKKTKHTVTVTGSDTLELNGNPGVFSQVISNLIMNSLIHAFEKNEHGEITIDVTEEEDSVIIQYKDNGKGIEKENLDKIFDPYFTTRREQGGSGLGMNIVKNLVTQKLNGDILCTSTPGQGVIFTIRIPERDHD
ncbi:MAG: hybrid sensor histidine kinase/response regulator [bacterium]|nr:hybrid sensor histidine kinase/response regulator [bacterium]